MSEETQDLIKEELLVMRKKKEHHKRRVKGISVQLASLFLILAMMVTMIPSTAFAAPADR